MTTSSRCLFTFTFLLFTFYFPFFPCRPAVAAETSAAPARAAILSGLPPLPAAPKLEKPAGKLLSTCWYLITCQDNKIGYLNQALYQLDGPAPLFYRLETRHFLKAALSENHPTVLSESIMFMDKDFNALRFTTTRRRGGALETISGEVADGQLAVTVTAEGQKTEKRSFSLAVTDHPTFAGAFLLWVGKQNLEAGQPLRRSVIDETSGAFQPQRLARATEKVEMKLEKGGGLLSESYRVSEQSGLMATGHLIAPDGLLVRSDGRNYNLGLIEAPPPTPPLKLDGTVAWENQLPGLAGHTFTSETYGYKLTLPSYPYLPVSAGDGKFLVFSNLTGGDAFYFLTFSVAPESVAGAAEKLYQTWAASFDSVQDVVTTTTTIDHLAAVVHQGHGRTGGRDFAFQVAVVVRGELAYLVASRDPWPYHPAVSKTFDQLLAGLAWTTVFGRDRGHWDGNDYTSDTFGYRLRLLAPLWRLPQQRTGVATNVEAVREDRAAMISVTLLPLPDAADLDQFVAAYQKSAETRVPGATDFQRRLATLAGRPAALLTYQAKALDNEPTETRHLIALDGRFAYVLTLVSKKSSLEENVKHFTSAADSFRFPKPESPPESAAGAKSATSATPAAAKP
jgi:hypothetical protein